MNAIAPLHQHPETWPALARAMELQWPDWYGPGGDGQALDDVHAYGGASGLPQGLVMLERGEPIGLVAIKPRGMASRPDWAPMLGAAWVQPQRRGLGLGAQLIRAAEALARQHGLPELYTATHLGARLFTRLGWDELEVLPHDGLPLHFFRKRLGSVPAP